MNFTKNFNQIDKRDAPSAGGKGASLGEMTQAGIAVPPGFVVLARTFERFLEDADLLQEIDTVLHSVNKEEMHTVESASEKIQALILSAEMANDVGSEIKKEFKKLGAKYVAVRSSATAEDGADHAWAGQLDSFLNTTEENLLSNVQKCWASLFTPRAIFYRFEKELHKQKISVAVVVQKMVESEYSGIAFSVHPVTEDRNQLIIEAGFGLGEAIVSGSVTPDSYVVEKVPRRIIDINVSTQTRGLIRANGGIGNEWVDIPEPRASSQVMTEEQILELAEIILHIENHYGFPCDIEWAFENKKFYITQSRPITTLSNKEQKNNAQISGKNYQQLFQIRGDVSFLLSSFFMEVYKLNKALVTFKDEMWKSFLPFDIKKENLEEGLKLYSNPQKYKDFKKKLFDHFASAEKTFDKILKKKSLTKEDLNTYLSNALEYHRLYSRTEFFYTDLAFENQEKNQIIKNNFKSFEKLKLKGREKLNKLILIGDSYYNRLIQKIASQFHLPIKEVYEYSLDETRRLFDGEKLNENEILSRKLAYMMIVKNDELKIYSGDEAETLINEFLKPLSKNKEIMKGQIAHKGKVKARAKVFNFTLNEFDQVHRLVDEMKNGEVLVAETTGPEIIAACHRASAIVTNQGGMMSHAAIVAREMNIPCVVGTGNATEIIKDGDLVEVDAERGIVTILKRSPEYPRGADKGVVRILKRFTESNRFEGEWELLKSSASPLIVGYNIDSWVKVSVSRYGSFAPLKKFLAYIKDSGNIGVMAVSKDDYVNSAKYLLEHRDILDSIFFDFNNDEKEFLSLVQQLENGMLSIAADFASFMDKYNAMYSSGVMLDGFLLYSDSIVEEIINKYPNVARENIATLTKVPNINFSQKEELNLMKIALSKKDEIDSMLNRHINNFHWVLNNYKNVFKLPKSYFEERLNGLLKQNRKGIEGKVAELESYKSEHNKAVEKIKDNGTINADDCYKLVLLGKIGWFVDRRKALNLLGNYWIGEYIRVMSKKYHLNNEDTLLLLPAEFEDVIAGRKNIFDFNLKDRRNEFGLICLDGSQEVVFGDELDKLKLIITPEINKKISEIKGKVAYKGKERGFAKIINFVGEKDFNEGEVLVTSMTRPDFVPLMKKAIAIITDEGGITSHAAIISRELKKPCIIGTKIATQVLKDGDLVEVDADKGIVRIIERAK